LLIIGAAAATRWASRRGASKGSWLARMLERKPVPVVAVALANKMARGIWAMLTRGEDYRGPVLIGASQPHEQAWRCQPPVGWVQVTRRIRSLPIFTTCAARLG
jgi:hypothetical protein